MKYHPGRVYHVYNQGNNRQRIFFEEENYHYFLRKVQRYIIPYADVLCYCLMPNHFHLLLCPHLTASLPSRAVKPRSLYQPKQRIQRGPDSYHGLQDDRQENLSQAIGTLLSSYTKAINKRYGHSGSLFRKRTKAKDGWSGAVWTADHPEETGSFRSFFSYPHNCFRYIHRNPVAAGLVNEAWKWPFSSAAAYAGLREFTLCNPQRAVELGLFEQTRRRTG